MRRTHARAFTTLDDVHARKIPSISIWAIDAIDPLVTVYFSDYVFLPSSDSALFL
jgi:hypothetical protein